MIKELPFVFLRQFFSHPASVMSWLQQQSVCQRALVLTQVLFTLHAYLEVERLGTCLDDPNTRIAKGIGVPIGFLVSLIEEFLKMDPEGSLGEFLLKYERKITSSGKVEKKFRQKKGR